MEPIGGMNPEVYWRIKNNRDRGMSLQNGPEPSEMQEMRRQVQEMQEFCIKTATALNSAWITDREVRQLTDRIEYLEKEVTKLRKARVDAKYFAPRHEQVV